MKLLLIATGYPRYKGDHSNVYLHRLARTFAKEGAETHVIAPHAHGLKTYEQIDEVHVHRFRYFPFSKLETLAYEEGVPEKIKKFRGKLLVPFFVLGMLIKIIVVAKRYNIDALNPHWALPTGYITMIANSFLRKPSILTIYGAEIFPFLKNKSVIFSKILKSTLNYYKSIFAISDCTKSAAQKIMQKDTKNVVVVPDGIDTDEFKPNLPSPSIIKELKKMGNKIVFTSGRMVERKGFVYLIQAIPLILQKFSKVIFLIGGNGPEKGKLESLVKKLNLEEKVLFLGFIDEKEFPGYLCNSDITVLPSIVDSNGDTEGSATFLLEAMACGTPVVGTNVGGMSTGIKNGIGGYLIEQKNPTELANKIVKLLVDKKNYEKMKKEARDYVIQHFSMNQVVLQYLTKLKQNNN